jgi:hypothetical protein
MSKNTETEGVEKNQYKKGKKQKHRVAETFKTSLGAIVLKSHFT